MQNIVRTYLGIDSSMSFTVMLSRLLIWALVLSVASWILIGLVSLRFDLEGGLGDILWSQLIVAGIVVVSIANAYAVERKIYGDSALSLVPVVWLGLSAVSLLMLIWQIWVDFNTEPNEILKVMYSLLAIGLCGTYAGIIAIPKLNQIYNPVRWAVYLLTAVVGVEILEELWSQAILSGADAGTEFATVGIYIAITLGGYAFVATIIAAVFRNHVPGVITYAIIGVAGFGIILLALWGSLDAGPLRFVFGASLLLAITTVAIVLMNRYEVGLPEQVTRLFQAPELPSRPSDSDPSLPPRE